MNQFSKTYEQNKPDEWPALTVGLICAIWAVALGWLFLFASERWYVHVITFFAALGMILVTFIALWDAIIWNLFNLFNREVTGTVTSYANHNRMFVGEQDLLTIDVVTEKREFRLLASRNPDPKRDKVIGQEINVRYVPFFPSIALISGDSGFERYEQTDEK